MFQGLWKEFREGFGKRWLLTVFGPSFVFWGACLFVYSLLQGWEEMLRSWDTLPKTVQRVLIAGVLTLVVFTAILLEQLTSLIVRLFEGYWPRPFRWLARWLRKRRRQDLNKKQQRFSQLKAKELSGEATEKDRAEVLRLDTELGRRPPDPFQTMPTLLGDVLRAAEDYPRRRYGLDPMVTWPRLYHSLGISLKGALTVARSNMDTLLRLTILSLAFAFLWGIWLIIDRDTLWLGWMVAIGLISALVTYSVAVLAAVIYGDLLRSAFDLHRFDLYKALHWPLPSSWKKEKPAPPDQALTCGQKLSAFLHRGLSVEDINYDHPRPGKE